ncbi:pentapeptide repeat-containing protein [Caulobacter sp. S45]|uniref:pentapeptide repeat-containing protein n=1 Tax=Caulobacter sp. S45 TaxID=1641861 RepID=UPI0015763FD3|nr:pentapeptide repeat-containing protein [Caulobacter sp. S45]
MRHSAFALAAVLVFAAVPAFAQSPVQIEHAKAGASCPRCNLFQADFSNVQMKGRDFAGARLRQADMSTAEITHTDFAGSDLRDLNAYGAVLGGSNFAGANLVNASLVGTYLQGANFRGAHLAGANFSGAEMDRAVGLTQSQLALACGDAATTAPPGLHLPLCR